MLCKEKIAKRSQKGITLVALTIMIIIILILAGITINSSIGQKGIIKQANSNIALSELSQIQELILEQYVKYQQTGNKSYIEYGTKIEKSSVEEILSQEGITTIDLKAENYYKLTPEDLQELGIQGTEDTYIVNYETGEVINSTLLMTTEGDILYICP